MSTDYVASKSTWAFNAAWVGAALVLFLFVGRDAESGVGLAVCYLVAAAALVVGISKAMAGDEVQLTATPIMGILLLAIVASVRPHENAYLLLSFVSLIAAAFGICICSYLISHRSRLLQIVAGVIAGMCGFGLTIWFRNLHAPIFSSYVYPDTFGTTDIVSNLAPGFVKFATGHSLGLYLFIAQSVALATWDALLFGVTTFVVGLLICIPFIQQRS
jgi:hypothetical protein